MEEEVVVNVIGGDDDVPQVAIHESEQDMRRLRSEQALIERREKILRYQIEHLEEELRLMGDDVDEEISDQFKQSVRVFLVSEF